MRIKNKKTGKIVDFNYLQTDYISPLLLTVSTNGRPEMFNYYSLAELNAEWEDVPEEPKEYWWIDSKGEVLSCIKGISEDSRRSIGNYFSTREEAEKAAKRLRAWKRLKDKGFKFGGHDDRDRGQLGDIVIYAEMPTFEYDDDSTRENLELLFGGEE